jgi:hypothetical protein
MTTATARVAFSQADPIPEGTTNAGNVDRTGGAVGER